MRELDLEPDRPLPDLPPPDPADSIGAWLELDLSPVAAPVAAPAPPVQPVVAPVVPPPAPPSVPPPATATEGTITDTLNAIATSSAQGAAAPPSGILAQSRARSGGMVLDSTLRRQIEDLEAQLAAARRDASDRATLIAGIAASGAGTLYGWQGSGPLRRSDLAAIANGYPIPEGLSPVRRLSEVIQADREYRATKVRARGREAGSATWNVASGAAELRRPGDPAGTVAVVATVAAGGTLTIEGDPALADRIRSQYQAHLAADELPSAVVSGWIAGILEDAGAARLGLGWFLPAGIDPRVVGLLDRLRAAGWGSYWTAGIPLATSSQVAESLGEGFRAEVDSHIARIEAEIEGAQVRRVGSLLSEIETLEGRVTGYQGVIGPGRVSAILARYADVRARLIARVDAAAVRAGLLELS